LFGLVGLVALFRLFGLFGLVGLVVLFWLFCYYELVFVVVFFVVVFFVVDFFVVDFFVVVFFVVVFVVVDFFVVVFFVVVFFVVVFFVVIFFVVVCVGWLADARVVVSLVSCWVSLCSRLVMWVWLVVKVVLKLVWVVSLSWLMMFFIFVRISFSSRVWFCCLVVSSLLVREVVCDVSFLGFIVVVICGVLLFVVSLLSIFVSFSVF